MFPGFEVLSHDLPWLGYLWLGWAMCNFAWAVMQLVEETKCHQCVSPTHKQL
jgi:hypothetical protein